MIKSFYKFYKQFAPSESGLSDVILSEYQKKFKGKPELSLVTKEDVLNIVLIDEYLGQDKIYLNDFEEQLKREQRIKTNQDIKQSCLRTLKKYPKPYHKRDWILRYQPDNRSKEQKEQEHLGHAIVMLYRDGVQAFISGIANNLDIMPPHTETPTTPEL